MRTPNPDRVIVATRASRLALTQTNLVVDALQAAHPGIQVEILEVTTTGDRDQRPFARIGGKGLFTTEVEAAVVAGKADIAVHSAKDLTARLASGCAILCVPARAERSDVVVGGSGDDGSVRLRDLPSGAAVGTSSMRRRALLAEIRGDLEAVEFRGNLDTRLEKVRSGVVAAAVLAAAGLERLGVAAGTGAALDPEWWVPSPGQGALAIEGLTTRDDLRALLTPLSDPATTAELAAERAFSERLEGGCSVPLGCSAVVTDDRIAITGYVGSMDGRSVRDRLSGPVSEAAALGAEVAEAILVGGGDSLLAEIEGRVVPAVEEP
jgi:hydroxymethylbilane synthase